MVGIYWEGTTIHIDGNYEGWMEGIVSKSASNSK